MSITLLLGILSAVAYHPTQFPAWATATQSSTTLLSKECRESSLGSKAESGTIRRCAIVLCSKT
jgi:hypothetical protein